jgi:hypothetical protein
MKYTMVMDTEELGCCKCGRALPPPRKMDVLFYTDNDGERKWMRMRGVVVCNDCDIDVVIRTVTQGVEG